MPSFLIRGAGALLLLSSCGSAVSGPVEQVKHKEDASVATAARASTPDGHPTTLHAAVPASTASAADRAFAAQLGTLLIGHATLDGAAVTSVRALDTCHTIFTTTTGATTVDWTKAGNLAPRDADGREINRLPSTEGWHELSVPLGELPEPAGNVANRSSGALGQLATQCA